MKEEIPKMKTTAIAITDTNILCKNAELKIFIIIVIFSRAMHFGQTRAPFYLITRALLTNQRNFQ
jgi:hypothetical protein